MTIPRHSVQVLLGVLIFAIALGVRLAQHHAALMYPDGYQYLLMARGISEHLRPTTLLGAGGDVFVPNSDAAAKPLFPLVVASVHGLGVSWLGAARIVTAVSGAAVVTLTGLLTMRLSRSRLAGAAAALLVLLSPTIGFWSGFSGPDPLAQALALGAVLALAYRRSRLGGVLLGLAVAARPEIAIIALGGAIAALPYREARRSAGRAALSFAVTLVVVFGLVRPPIALPDRRLLVLAVPLLAAVALLAFAPRRATPTGLAAAVALAVAALGTAVAPGLSELWHNDWPLLGLATVGVAVAARDPERRPAVISALGAALILGAVYWAKNPELERYFAGLLPIAAILVGLGIAALPPRRWLATAVVPVVVAAALLPSPIPGNRDEDAFSAVAAKLSPTIPRSTPLVTAAPDAYGFWLPGKSVHAMRPGARGLILLDSAQRSFAPELGARGKVVTRLEIAPAFIRPDGEIDPGAVEVVAGRVVRLTETRQLRRLRPASRARTRPPREPSSRLRARPGGEPARRARS